MNRNALYFFLISISVVATAAADQIKPLRSPNYSEFEPIASPTDQKKCLKTLSYAPTTGKYPKLFFQKMGSEEILIGRCPQDETMNYVVLSEKALKALKFPIYRFITQVGVSAEKDYLPNPSMIHFKHEGKDLYLGSLAELVQVLTPAQIPTVLAENMSSMARVNKDNKKYEDYLKSIDKLSSLNVSSDTKAVESIMPCLLDYQQKVIQAYLQGKFNSWIPAQGTIRNDYNQFSKLSEAERKKYIRPFDDMRKDMIKDLLNAHPICQGVIEDPMIEAAFENNWGINKDLYEKVRLRFIPAP